MTDQRIDLVGLSRQELKAEMERIGEKAFRAKQLWQWIYHYGVRDFTKMTNISKNLHGKLAEHFYISRPETAEELTSVDRTRKWLYKFDDGNEAETVFIPEEDRGAVCISSQVGCTLTCKFCHTGTQLLVRNLSAGEIVGQFMAARDSYDEWPSPPGDKRMLTNIVLMGMGEPLYNFDNTVKALKILMDQEGISVSKRRITLSTSGVVPEIRRLGEVADVELAISLHAPTDEVRNEIMPINKKYPLKDLMAAVRDYPAAINARRITFEYVMLKGINDSEADARALTRLVKDIPCKFNLIPFNPWPGSDYECSGRKTIKRFVEILNRAGYTATTRVTRGQDILAACGQLKSESERVRCSRMKARIEAGIEDESHVLPASAE
ncbi:Dual-specificity RNA methyltransferase RlmN [Candidatus Terasakiella magnetica]|uniref:Dual-specificity RNA methyltransferase RlmN n=1 Tax=Candidatus Terasakiella magnetica TaxID=1867952 RepID=A0A1C3RGM1_9PROT|nr:23S rRNA (adenine(2503)-C(2))-methyltransferase RlmN [Candidatus Terasakiella magnetica]SCA56415.1 Dual-specificity RNA methyltransferase RlmN [Candidatus Terasakiella magnetica]